MNHFCVSVQMQFASYQYVLPVTDPTGYRLADSSRITRLGDKHGLENAVDLHVFPKTTIPSN
jgi:hypothetical protein